MYRNILSSSTNGKCRKTKPNNFEISKKDKKLLEEKKMVDISEKCEGGCFAPGPEKTKTVVRAVPRYPCGPTNPCSLIDPPTTKYPPSQVPDADLDERVFGDIPDSGKREDFLTGSVRDTRKGKGRFDLVSPIALKRIAQHYENGARKYKDRNWEKGQEVTRYFDSAMRHMNDLMTCKLMFREEKEDHLAAVAWNIMAIMHTEAMVKEGLLPVELIDWPQPACYTPPEVK